MDNEFGEILNDFKFEQIPEDIYFFKDNDLLEESEYQNSPNLFVKTLNNLFFSWFVKCWQESGGMDVKTFSYLNFYYVGGLGINLHSMVWNDDYDSVEKEVDFINIGIIDETEIDLLSRMPLENEPYTLYFENKMIKGKEIIGIELLENNLYIKNYSSENVQIEKFSYQRFKTFLEEKGALSYLNKYILEYRKLGYKVIEKPKYLKEIIVEN